MDSVLDIESLQKNTGLKPEAVKRLLLSFVSMFHELITEVQHQFPDNESESYNTFWKSQMHQLRGCALNVCAHSLIELSTRAEAMYECSLNTKREILAALHVELKNIEESVQDISL